MPQAAALIARTSFYTKGPWNPLDLAFSIRLDCVAHTNTRLEWTAVHLILREVYLFY